MAVVERIMKAEPAVLVGLGLATIAFPFLFPSLRPQWGAGIKGAAKLFFEAEGGAEGEIIDHLAESAIDDLADAVAESDPQERTARARTVVHSYARRAHRRSARRGRTDQEHVRRYRRHISTLREKVLRRRAHAPPSRRADWDAVLQALDQAEAQPSGPAQKPAAAPRPAAAQAQEVQHGVRR